MQKLVDRLPAIPHISRVTLLATLIACSPVTGGETTMAEYEGARPIEDTGPNEAVGAPAGFHWQALDDGSNPRFNPESGPGSTEALRFNATAKRERLRIEAKPRSVASCSTVKVRLIQQTDGTFDAASGFMEFGLSLYKADGTTLLGTATTHIPNQYDPTLPDPGANGPYWEVQAYTFGGLSLTQAEIDAGLILELDSTAADGWVGGGTWWVFAAWLGHVYTASEDFTSLIDGDSRIKDAVEGYSPITTCVGDAPIEPVLEGSAVIDPPA